MSAPPQSQNLLADIAGVASLLEDKANRARRTAYFCLGATLVIGLVILFAFLVFGQVAAQDRALRQNELVKLQYDSQLRAVNERKSLLDSATKALSDSKVVYTNGVDPNNAAKAAIDSLVVKVDNATSPDKSVITIPQDDLFYNITSSVIRIGAVLIGIFLIQIMVSFGRYYFKIAEHLSMSASLITLSGGRITDLKAIIPLLLPSKIDFGKEPKPPSEKALEGALGAIKGLAAKLPAR